MEFIKQGFLNRKHCSFSYLHFNKYFALGKSKVRENEIVYYGLKNKIYHNLRFNLYDTN